MLLNAIINDKKYILFATKEDDQIKIKAINEKEKKAYDLKELGVIEEKGDIKKMSESNFDINDLLSKYECDQAELEEIVEMLWYVYEDYYSNLKIDIFTKANNYDRLRVFLFNIFSLLSGKTKEMNNTIKDFSKNK